MSMRKYKLIIMSQVWCSVTHKYQEDYLSFFALDNCNTRLTEYTMGRLETILLRKSTEARTI